MSKVPKINLKKSILYFKSLIDENGIIQFTKGYEKDYSFGYAIEDQARALILCIYLKDFDLIRRFYFLIESSLLKDKGVDLLRNAKGELSGRPDNFKEASSEVLWSLCELKNSLYGVSFQPKLDRMIDNLEKGLLKSRFLRVWAYSLLGLSFYDKKLTSYFADRLINKFERERSKNWLWFEDKLTYANALFPWSLFRAFLLTGRNNYLKVAELSLGFLLSNLVKDNLPVVVGNKGWWKKGGKMALFGQQPIDVSYLVLCLVEAYLVTKKDIYKEKALFYYGWFFGNNISKKSMIREDGACFDGLYKGKVNENAGAESNICYLLASISLKKAGILKL